MLPLLGGTRSPHPSGGTRSSGSGVGVGSVCNVPVFIVIIATRDIHQYLTDKALRAYPNNLVYSET